MCRNIKPLFNFEPSASDAEVHDATLQFVRKISGFSKPSKVNQPVFDEAVEHITQHVKKFLSDLTTAADPKNREVEALKRQVKYQHRHTTD